MIMKFSNSSFAYNGRVNDEIWISSGTRGTGRLRTRPATRATSFEYRALFSLAPARAEWANLDSSTQDDWDTFAAATFGWPIQGSPRFMDGETFFANYYTVLLTLDEWASVPDVPDSGPTWQTKPKFFEFATWESGIYTLKAEAEFEIDTQLICSGLPPSTTGFKPDFAREVFIGSEELYGGLLPNDEWDSVHYMMENHFGTITENQKIWGRIWEVQDGYIRTLKDPCTPDPTDTPPGEDELGLTLFNDDWDWMTLCSIYAMEDEWSQIGYVETYNMEPSETREITLTLDEGYTLEDIQFLNFDSFWFEGGWNVEQVPYDDSNPFEWTLIPI